MTFASIEYRWLLLLLPLGVWLGYFAHKQRMTRVEMLAQPHVLAAIGPPLASSGSRYIARTAFLCAVILLSTFAALGPRYGFSWQEAPRRGIDLALLVDLSDSMLAQDIQPTRLERARRKIIDLLSLLRGDRVSLVTFAGVAFVESPLTADYAAFQLFLENLQPDFAPVKGSNLEVALEKSFSALGAAEKRSEKSGKIPASRTRAVILMSDGEGLEGDIDKAIAKAKSLGVRLFAIGIGTPEGSPIVTDKGYKKDKDGRVVVTRLQEDVLQRLANETGGRYVRSVASDDDLNAVYLNGIKSMLSDTAFEGERTKRWNEYFQIPLMIVLSLLLLGPWNALLSLKTSRERSQGPKNFALCLMTLAVSLSLPTRLEAQSPEELGKQARQLFEAGDFENSLKTFSAGNEQAQQDHRFSLGIGASRYRLGDFEGAKAAFFEAANQATNKQEKAAALYNAGNSYVRLESFQDAIKTYNDVLAITPEDQEAKDNLAYAKKLLAQQQKQNKEDDQEKDQKQKSSEQDKNSEGSKGDSSEDEQSKDQKQDPSDSKDDNEQSQSEKQKQTKDEQESPKESEQSKDEKQNQSQSDSQQPSDKNQTSDQQSEESAEQNEQEQGSSGEEQEKDSPEKKSGESSPEPSPTPENSAQQPQAPAPEKSAGEEKEQTASTGQSADDMKPQTSDSLDSLLDGLQEKNDSRLKYRGHKGAQELKTQERKPPLKDW